MTDADNDRTAPETGFETDEVSATRGREQGLGVGARELAAQRDPGGDIAPDGGDEGVEVIRGDAARELDDSLGVQGTDDADDDA